MLYNDINTLKSYILRFSAQLTYSYSTAQVF